MPRLSVKPVAVAIETPAVPSTITLAGNVPLAVGGTLATLKVKVSDVAAPLSSVAVTTTE